MIDEVSITIDYDETMVSYDRFDVGTLTLNFDTPYDSPNGTDNGDAVKVIIRSYSEEFDGAGNGTILKFYFVGQPEDVSLDNLDVIAFSADTGYGGPVLTIDNVQLELKTEL